MGRLGFLALPALLVLTGASLASAQALADPGRSADATFLAKASEATALDAELATLAATRAANAAVKAFARQVLDARAAHRSRAHRDGPGPADRVWRPRPTR